MVRTDLHPHAGALERQDLRLEFSAVTIEQRQGSAHTQTQYFRDVCRRARAAA